MSINFNLDLFISTLLNSFKSYFFGVLITCGVIFIYLVINNNNKISKYSVVLFNFITIVLINIFYFKKFILFQYSNPICNLYFYFINTIIYLILFTISIFKIKDKYRKLNYIYYGINIVFILYSLFYTHYLNNIPIIVIGNIYSFMIIGNILYILYYLFLLIVFLTKKK